MKLPELPTAIERRRAHALAHVVTSAVVAALLFCVMTVVGLFH